MGGPAGGNGTRPLKRHVGRTLAGVHDADAMPLSSALHGGLSHGALAVAKDADEQDDADDHADDDTSDCASTETGGASGAVDRVLLSTRKGWGGRAACEHNGRDV